MTDIVERLRGGTEVEGLIILDEHCLEAADEIEALRQRVKELEGVEEDLDTTSQHNAELQLEFAALKAQQGKPAYWVLPNGKVLPEKYVTRFGSKNDQGEFKYHETEWIPLYTAAPSIPEGWQLVPVEPTRDMLFAVIRMFTSHTLRGQDTDTRDAYQVLLLAAPKPAKETE